jgi:hypothetical protein
MWNQHEDYGAWPVRMAMDDGRPSSVTRQQRTEGCKVQPTGQSCDLLCESYLVPTVSRGLPCSRAGVQTAKSIVVQCPRRRGCEGDTGHPEKAVPKEGFSSPR